MENKLELLKPRTFNEVINDALVFIRMNINPLGKVIITLVLPLTILGSFFVSLHTGPGFGTRSYNFVNDTHYSITMFGYLILAVAGVIQKVAIIYLFESCENPETSAVASGEIFQGVRARFLRLFGFRILIYFLIVFICIAVVLLGALGGSVLLAVFVIILGAGGVYTLVVLSLSSFIYMREGIGIFDAFSRSAYLTKGHLWETFGIALVATLLALCASFIFCVPYYGLSFIKTLHQTSLEPGWANDIYFKKIFYVFMNCGTGIIFAFPDIAIILQYYSLIEQKDGLGLYKQIEEIGGNESPSSL